MSILYNGGINILYRITFGTNKNKEKNKDNVCCGIIVKRIFFHYPMEHRYLIIRTAPILKKFIHQDFINLQTWIHKIGGTIDECK